MDTSLKTGTAISAAAVGVGALTSETRSIKVNSKPINLESNFTGKKEVRLLGYSRDPQVTIEQNDPLDMQVNGFISEVVI